MAEVHNALPADEVVCATIKIAMNRYGWGEESVFTGSLDHLYGGSCRRASARLRGLRGRGLVESRTHPGCGLVWWLTPEGETLAKTALPACRKCCEPVEPDLHDHWVEFCRSCVANLIEGRAADAERSVRYSRKSLDEETAKAQMLRALAATLRDDGGVLLDEETF